MSDVFRENIKAIIVGLVTAVILTWPLHQKLDDYLLLFLCGFIFFVWGFSVCHGFPAGAEKNDMWLVLSVIFSFIAPFSVATIMGVAARQSIAGCLLVFMLFLIAASIHKYRQAKSAG